MRNRLSHLPRDSTTNRIARHTQAFDAARVGVVFNFLSNRPHREWDGRDLTPARRYDTVDWLDWAMGRTPLVRFSQAYYRGHDATIAMFKSD